MPEPTKCLQCQELFVPDNIDPFCSEICRKEYRLRTMKLDPFHYLYLMKLDRTDFYKIGISKSTPKRNKSLQSSLPANLLVIAQVRCNNRREAKEREEFLLTQLQHYKARGEWLYVPDNELPKLLEIAFNPSSHVEDA